MRTLAESKQLLLEPLEVLDRHIVGKPVRNGPDDKHLFNDVHRHVLRLLEDLGQAFAAFELVLRRFVEVRAKLSECRQLAKLCKVDTQRTGDLLHRLDLCRTADAARPSYPR